MSQEVKPARFRAAGMLGAALVCSSSGCHEETTDTPRLQPAKAATSSRPAAAEAAWLANDWDPETGRGTVTHHQPGAGTLTTSFHVAFAGYTGGLVIGGYSSSGLAWVPERPQPGFPRINIFCAQDESIWDTDERREYSYGWSENFGTGPDGVRLEYVRGRVLEASRDRVALLSENRGGCYEVRKIATTWATARFWIIATRITNRCERDVHFDFYSGDDPWLGTYKSSDGDVGWTPLGAVRHEARFEAGDFTAGGLVDLGNLTLGQREGSFSNEASFFALDPSLPLPGETLFANRFAHGPSEIDPERPLDNRTMTALNLGWVGRTLRPRESMDVALALGHAVAGDAVGTPRLPHIDDEHWSRWRRFTEPNPGPVRHSAEFAAELVEMEVSKTKLEVHGRYSVVNRSAASVAYTIGFPLSVAADRPSPAAILVDGREVPLVPESPDRVSARFVLSIPPLSMKSFEIRYSQRHSGRRAEYVVTSALTWNRPIARAVFRVVGAADLGPIRTSHVGRSARDARGRSVVTIVRQPFVPDREMVVTW